MNQKIEPVRKEITVPCDGKTAFLYYTESISSWWPKATHSLFQEECAKITMEPKENGRIFEISKSGEEKDWGKILVWESHTRFVNSWHLSRGPEQCTEIEIRFEELSPSETLVKVEHRNWEVWGDEAAAMREQYNGGWELVLGKAYKESLIEMPKPMPE